MTANITSSGGDQPLGSKDKFDLGRVSQRFEARTRLMRMAARASLVVLTGGLLVMLFVVLPGLGLSHSQVTEGLLGGPPLVGIGLAVGGLVWINLLFGPLPTSLEVRDGVLVLRYPGGSARELTMNSRKGILLRDGRSPKFLDPSAPSGGIILASRRVVPLSREAVERVLDEANRLNLRVTPTTPLGGGPTRLRISSRP